MAHVLIVCDRRYNGHQLWVALGTLTKRGHTYELISTHRVIEDEVTHKRNRIERIVGEVDKSELGTKFLGFMVISGHPTDTHAYWMNDTVRGYVVKFNNFDLPIAAICASVPTIRDAAKGKKVSYFPLIKSRELLKQAGAIPQSVALTCDDNLVTAEHEMASQVWVDTFCNLLEGKPSEYNFTSSEHAPKAPERKPIPILEDLKRKLSNNAPNDPSQHGDSTPTVS